MIVPVEEVHHIKPLTECGTHERDNLISLCKSCHVKIHVKSGDRWHKKNHENTHG
ncbi:HNH endonuclease signature motif containing protein [Clostridium estertheticum]|uniref:HNH endonuclease n=1 Tax=Clostridium estertheticum TaxID=238834 RepID=UPI0028165973|nr:HNH endonuclease signature motif containing protein [Clostridium estertheticum]